MERNDIIKALECCTDGAGECDDCPLIHDNFCGKHLLRNALVLIKELTEENASLKQCMEHEHSSFMETFGELDDKCKRLTEENERLRVVEGMSDTTLTDALRIVNEFCDKRIKRAKADTVREMQSKLEEKIDRSLNVFDFNISECNAIRQVLRGIKNDIHQIAEEMIGGSNAQK